MKSSIEKNIQNIYSGSGGRRRGGSKSGSGVTANPYLEDLVLYEARDGVSRQKLISHFGVDCAIRTGAGSRMKLENIYGGSHANVITVNTNHHRRGNSNSFINGNNGNSHRRRSISSMPVQPLNWNSADLDAYLLSLSPSTSPTSPTSPIDTTSAPIAATTTASITTAAHTHAISIPLSPTLSSLSSSPLTPTTHHFSSSPMTNTSHLPISSSLEESFLTHSNALDTPITQALNNLNINSPLSNRHNSTINNESANLNRRSNSGGSGHHHSHHQQRSRAYSTSVDHEENGVQTLYSNVSGSNGGSGHRSSTSRHVSAMAAANAANPLDILVQPGNLSKLYDFFGRDAPIDLPFEEVEMGGLSYLVQSSVPLAHFIEYELKHRQPEVIFFFLDVVNFEEKIFPDASASLMASQSILTTYLCMNSPLECTITPRARCYSIKAIKAGQRRCFKAPKQELLPILERHFDDFKNSQRFAELKKSFGHLNAYPESTRLELIQSLLAATNRYYPVETATTKLEATQARTLLTKIQEYCKARLANKYGTTHATSIPSNTSSSSSSTPTTNNNITNNNGTHHHHTRKNSNNNNNNTDTNPNINHNLKLNNRNSNGKFNIDTIAESTHHHQE